MTKEDKSFQSSIPLDHEYKALPIPDKWEMSDKEMISKSEEFYELMKKRHTVREYSSRPVPREVIENCIRAAGLAPSGANHQPWHFAIIENPDHKQKIRDAAEEEEKTFYAGRASDEWLGALEPIGTNDHKPHLTEAPWLIVIFAQRTSIDRNGRKFKNYYVNESVGIATGFLITALHKAGLSTLTHTPNPMKFLNELCGRPSTEKPEMILVVGHPAEDATVPTHAKWKKPLEEIMTVF
ncbi:nitroreductase family protein [Emcibacteraceae bacterium]|nr:nitroreductase family protein [Emcibacteraceae bacterium]MDA9179877.1 nitroreductase family protein [Emcibacteraceae bacterium]MDA9554299.1 nitroreductase family protein [Emcibacteraceae bacterium]